MKGLEAHARGYGPPLSAGVRRALLKCVDEFNYATYDPVNGETYLANEGGSSISEI